MSAREDAIEESEKNDELRKIEDITPVFIGGAWRSGTTLLGSMLGNHSDCFAPPETTFKIGLLTNFTQEERTKPPEEFLEILRNKTKFQVWNFEIPEEEIKLLPDPVQLSLFLKRVVALYAKRKAQKEFTYWIDHAPRNARDSHFLKEMYPEAKFIHLIRDGRGVINSVMDRDWGPNTVIEAARQWKVQLSYGMAMETSMKSNNVLRIRYEDLLEATEKTMQKISSFLGMEYEQRIGSSNQSNVSRYSTKQHQLVGSELDTSRIDAWKEELTEREVEIIENRTNCLLDHFGYRSMYGTKNARSASRWEKVKYFTFEVFLRLLRNVKHYIRVRTSINND